MPFVMVRHPVKDYAAWKAAFDQAIDLRVSAGEQYYRIFQPDDDPKMVVGLFQWNSLAKARTFFGSSELKEAMEAAGVTGPPEIAYLEETAQGEQ